MTKKTGGSAFPSENVDEFFYGMTLRDYFAAKAMQSLIIHYGDEGYTEAAEHAYALADAMLAERAK
jgi:hypothetical protein